MIVVVLAVFWGIALFQTAVSPQWAVMGLKPDLIPLVVLNGALLYGWGKGLLWGALGAIALTFYSVIPFPLIPLALMPVALLVGLRPARSIEYNLLLALAAVFTGTILFYCLLSLEMLAIGEGMDWRGALTRVIFPTALLNTLFTPPVYMAMRWWHKRTKPEYQPGF